VLAPKIAVLVAVLVAKVTMNLPVFPARQSIGVRVGMFIVESIVIVMMVVAQLLVLRVDTAGPDRGPSQERQCQA